MGVDELDDLEPYGTTPWAVPDAVKEMPLSALRPWALRVLFHILKDDELSARLRLDAAKIVVDKTKDGDSGTLGVSEDVDAEVQKLVEELRRRG